MKLRVRDSMLSRRLLVRTKRTRLTISSRFEEVKKYERTVHSSWCAGSSGQVGCDRHPGRQRHHRVAESGAASSPNSRLHVSTNAQEASHTSQEMHRHTLSRTELADFLSVQQFCVGFWTSSPPHSTPSAQQIRRSAVRNGFARRCSILPRALLFKEVVLQRCFLSAEVRVHFTPSCSVLTGSTRLCVEA